MDNFDRLSAMLVQHEVLTPEPPGTKSKSQSTKRGPKRPARRGHLAMAAMLAERGVLVWYDAEGDFMNPGAHARVVMAAAKCARLGKVSIEDRYIDGKGRLMSLRMGGSTEWLLSPVDPTLPEALRRPSKWVDATLVWSALLALGAPRGLVPVGLDVGDQTTIEGLLPKTFVDALLREGIAKEYEAHLASLPDDDGDDDDDGDVDDDEVDPVIDPDYLVLQLERTGSVVTLSGQQARELV